MLTNFIKRKTLGFILLALIISPLVHAKTEGLLVTGNDWLLMISIPSDWAHHSQEDTLQKYRCNAAVFRSESDIKNGGPIIQVSAFTKNKNGTLDDFNHDKLLEQSASKTPVQIVDNKVEHPEYKAHSYVSSKSDGYWSVVTYLDTTQGLKYDISAVMALSRKPTPDELSIYWSVVASLKMYNTEQKKAP